MNYSALDRFQGMWLGSIIGFALSNNSDQSDYQKLYQADFPSWIETRDEIAKIIIQNHQKELILKQIAYFLSQTPKINLQKHHCDIFLILLSLTIIQEDNANMVNICSEAVAQSYGISVDTAEIEQEFVIWNYLITSALNSQLQFSEPNVSMIVKQILGGAKVSTSSLAKGLEIVSQAWERGLSLQKLTEIYEQENEKSKLKLENSLFQPTVSFVIAMSFYCFISTPKNFMLSVKRAASIPSKLSTPITIFTASISGAYNGFAHIPRSWKLAANHHPLYQQTQETAQRLFKYWLGVHNLDNQELSYNSEFHAVADHSIFQPRQNLKIISQKSSLDQS